MLALLLLQYGPGQHLPPCAALLYLGFSGQPNALRTQGYVQI